jgi:tetratricopeptide (TPR) repeat protein
MSVPRSNQPNPKKPEHRGDRISGNIGVGGRFVVVGKNIIQIGTLEIPKNLVIAILLVLMIGFCVAFRYLDNLSPHGSPKMVGAFNVAVAEFGEMDNHHQIKSSEIGKQLSYFVFDILKKQNQKIDNDVVKFWHNSLPKTERGTEIKHIYGDSETKQEEEANKEATRINANFLIFGNLDQKLEFLPKFYISKKFKGPDTIIGQYALGDPITIDRAYYNQQQREVTDKTTTLFWLIKGLVSHNQGQPQDAIKYFGIAANNWQGKGKEVVHFFIGQSALFPANEPDIKQKEFDQYIDRAKKEFTTALEFNSKYIRAQIGLGSVYIVQANRQLSRDSCTDSICAEQVLEKFIEPAIREYEKALKFPVVPHDASWAKGSAPLGLGIAYQLKGETALLSQNRKEASTLSDRAIEQITKSLDVFVQKQEYRLLGQAYLALGNTYRQKAESNPTLHQAIRQAISAYQKCQAVPNDAPYDLVLTKQVIQRCKTAIDEIS